MERSFGDFIRKLDKIQTACSYAGILDRYYFTDTLFKSETTPSLVLHNIGKMYRRLLENKRISIKVKSPNSFYISYFVLEMYMKIYMRYNNTGKTNVEIYCIDDHGNVNDIYTSNKPPKLNSISLDLFVIHGIMFAVESSHVKALKSLLKLNFSPAMKFLIDSFFTYKLHHKRIYNENTTDEMLLCIKSMYPGVTIWASGLKTGPALKRLLNLGFTQHIDLSELRDLQLKKLFFTDFVDVMVYNPDFDIFDPVLNISSFVDNAYKSCHPETFKEFIARIRKRYQTPEKRLDILRVENKIDLIETDILNLENTKVYIHHPLPAHALQIVLDEYLKTREYLNFTLSEMVG